MSSGDAQGRTLAQRRAYGGYFIEAPTDDHFLTRVGRGTPCGEYLRRSWHPFLIASELKHLPLVVRLLGEDLVVFRDKSGQVGLLHKHCLHRGASLEFGIVAERGIRCSYHGWHFDVDGSILDTPAEPPASRIKNAFCQGAYRVRESHGLLFAYLGPPDEVPEFPLYDTFSYPPDNRLAPFRMNLPCNWLQIVENAADPIHNAFLHAIVAGQQFSSAFKVLPQLDYPETPLGFLSMATRKVGEFVFIRASDIILPNVGQFPNGGNTVETEGFAVRPFITRWVVPVDDTSSFYIGVAHLNAYNAATMDMDPEKYGVDRFPFIGQTGDRPYEERQLEPGDYDAVVSQGAIANRKAEHLGTSDRGVAQLRRALTKAITAVQDGKPVAPYKVDSRGRVRTYVHETVIRASNKLNLDDAKALQELGRRAAMVFVETDGLDPDERERCAEGRIRALLQTAHAA
jgi:nitrite reductase/ring-hydroxylating ferredoxin subunit